jgi:ABC-type nitrate/sulfonate/bicarbonate transport system ATPase subunit
MGTPIPLEIAGLTKTFATPVGPVVAVQDVNARVHDGEFTCILGHSGCGKSTVLSIIAGLHHATHGRVVIDGAEADGPGTDRAVVFQTPCLLPWLTVRGNVALAVRQASPHLTRTERRAQVNRYLELVGVADAAGQLPGELSLGMQQCVSLARALSVDPRFLLLDEPFSMLDSLTRFELQDMLLQVWEQNRKIVVMVTRRRRGALSRGPSDSHDRRPLGARRGNSVGPVSASTRADGRPGTPAVLRVPRPRHRFSRKSRRAIGACGVTHRSA